MPAGLEILNLHAQGGMAEVYRARATDAQGRTWQYAVKRILPELVKDPDMMRMFVDEQRVAACLEHDNIVRVYDVAASDTDDVFIVMEFLEGKDVQEMIEAAHAARRHLPVWLAMQVARDVLRALHYASTQAKDKRGRPLGLIHRDISPHNIIITRSGHVKLTDFGVARVETADVRTRAGVIKGKFGYMSPEQLGGQTLDARSDLYNVGILLYEMLTCERLFSGETATQFIASMMANEVPPLAAELRVPRELDQLLRRSLSRDREARPASAAVFEKELAAIVARYRLQTVPQHLADELTALFPELGLNAEPDPNTVPLRLDEIQPRRAPTQAKHLRAMGNALDGLLASQIGAPHEDDADVFATSPAPPQRATPPRSAPPQQAAPRVPSRPRAVVDDDADAVTVYEPRPDLGPSSEVDRRARELEEEIVPNTEPSRRPAALASLASSETAPRRGRRGKGAPPSGPTWDEATQNTVRSMTAEPAAAPPASPSETGDALETIIQPRAPKRIPPAPNRVSTNTRRVISLEGDHERSGPKPKKPR